MDRFHADSQTTQVTARNLCVKTTLVLSTNQLMYGA